MRANVNRALITASPATAESAAPDANTAGVEPDADALRAAGIDGLANMLHDDRSPHRLAGVWLAGRILLHNAKARAGRSWPELASRIVELARSDDDAAVRARAGAFAVRLRHQLKTGAVRRRSRRSQLPAEVAS